ncbi:hypothetical protein WJ17_20255 [Burkholderia vietnamiensis]|nr:hypothetical protein WJ04_20485 [Burkholderia vietnamiensis]KVF14324.1 hypothetical protein WJ05_00045 [Burkholderia vietnamiensis]KVF65778.1 hypothetical protein WJ17_20255 [Burkholderia vietnamiensis]
MKRAARNHHRDRRQVYCAAGFVAGTGAAFAHRAHRPALKRGRAASSVRRRSGASHPAVSR